MIKRILAAMMAFVLIFSCMPVSHAHAAEISTTASGTTYYVSSLHGAEGNDGTSESAPFASLLKINDITLQPGDRVLLERGSIFVDEYLHVTGSGSADAPIIIDAYGDESQPLPLIQTNGNGVWYQDYGKRLDNTWHKYQGNVSSCILLYDVEYIEISNIAMTNEGNFAEGESYNTYGRMDRTGVAGIAENIGTVDHIYLRNLDIRNVQGSVHDKHMANGGIYLLCHNPDDESATGVSRFDDVLIEGCRLDEVNRWGIAVGYTAYWDQFTYASTIDPDICRTYGSTNVVIRNNYLTNVGGDGITTMYCYQPMIEYNVLDGYCQDMTIDIYGNNNQRVAAGIWPWMCKTPILQYNEAYNSTLCPDSQAWDADWGDNAIYQYNYSCNNAGGAVMFCGQYACNTVFRYNISQYDLEGVLNLAGSPNGEIYNNVFYIKEGVKINRTGMSGGIGNTISNNIFYYTGSTPASATYGNWGDITAEWSNNIYYNYATTPDDAYAITDDPMFVDPGKGPTGAQANGLVHSRSVFEGYKLQSGSPAIDAGMPIADNGGLDFFGNEVDLLPDIGAYDAGTCSADASSARVVNLELGESITLTDLSGDYSATTPTIEDSKIASVVLARKENISQSTVSSTAATSLEDGASYMICNTNTGSALTNVMGDASYWGTQALLLSGDKTLSDANTWVLESDGSGYKIRSADGTYLSIALNASSLGASGDTFTAATSGSSDVWTFLNGNGYYLDNLGRYDFLGGWTEIGNSSTWKHYKINTATLDAVTELTFTGLYPGTTNIIVGDTLYQVRVSGQLQEVELEAGETATFTDETGNYVGADTTALDETVATVELTGVATQVKSLGTKVTTLVSGREYVIVNTRAAKPLSNAEATAAAAAGAGSGLNLTGTKENVVDSAVWTITGADGSYTVQDCNGQYLTVGSTTAGITDTATALTLNYNGSTWTISLNGAYLNDFGGAGSCAAGWADSSASGDSGSQWEIYEVTLTDEENGGTNITFTAVGPGETHVQIGDVMYHITVAAPVCAHANTEIRDAAQATCTAEGYTGDTWCTDCGTQLASGTTIPVADHSYENGTCTVCGAVTGIACNTSTNVVYATVEEALDTAEAGQTVELLTDCTAATVMVIPGVTLDLKGFELTASYAAGFSSAHIVDSVGSGRLTVDAQNVVLDEKNSMIPVYDGEGYIFTKAGFAIRQDAACTNGFKIDAVACPVNMDAVELLKDGGADNNVQIVIILSWDTDEGTGSQKFVFTDEVVAQVYSSNNGTWSGYDSMFSMVVTGFESIENLSAQIAVLSGTNATYISATAVDIT